MHIVLFIKKYKLFFVTLSTLREYIIETSKMLFTWSYVKWTTKTIKKLRKIQSIQAISVVAVHRY